MIVKSPIEQMLEHQSIRKFTSRVISQEVINTCVTAGQAASSSSFLQVTSVVQVNSPLTRAALAETSGGQNYVQSAATFWSSVQTYNAINKYVSTNSNRCPSVLLNTFSLPV